MTRQRRSSGRANTASTRIPMPPGAHALAAIGPQTEEVVHRLLQSSDGSNTPNLFSNVDEEGLKELADALRAGWRDAQAAIIVSHYEEAIRSGRRLDTAALIRWVRSHPNDAQAVLDCMTVEPPDEISITRVLSRAGSQKLVFLATWKLTQKQVVVKSVIGPPEIRDRIFKRESQSHPLSIRHSNIIETHWLNNAAGDFFLVEERLPMSLNDNWRSHGLQEAANLLYDIAKALNYLHNDLSRAHGDIKPDNIGKRNGDYVLLDFGICRPIADFSFEMTATGSLRTRAPELFEGQGYRDPAKADIWALGATVFNALIGRFPLFNTNESPPRISKPEERAKFESVIADRVRTEWFKRVDLCEVQEPLNRVLAETLRRNPKERINAKSLCKMAEEELSSFLRGRSEVGHFSALDEVKQLLTHLPHRKVLGLMPDTEKHSLVDRLSKLAQIPQLPREQKQRLEELASDLRV